MKNNSVESIRYEFARMRRFVEYFRELYGTGLEVSGYHLNGGMKDFDEFFDEAVNAANEPPFTLGDELPVDDGVWDIILDGGSMFH